MLQLRVQHSLPVFPKTGNFIVRETISYCSIDRYYSNLFYKISETAYHIKGINNQAITKYFLLYYAQSSNNKMCLMNYNQIVLTS